MVVMMFVSLSQGNLRGLDDLIENHVWNVCDWVGIDAIDQVYVE